MIQPGHDLSQGARHLPRSLPCRPLDQNHRQTQGTGRIQFCPPAASASILGDQMRNAMHLHQCAIPGLVKWPARDYSFRIGQGQASHRINQPQQVMVLRLCGKGRQMLPADGQKDPDGCVGQSRNRAGDVLHNMPVIARFRHPCRTLEPDQRHACCYTGQGRIPTHLGCERMGRIDHVADILCPQIGRQPLCSAKAAHAHRDRLDHRGSGAAGIGIHGIKARRCQHTGEFTGLRRATEQKDAFHG